jgi:PAS domain S-box-containing protein
MNSRMVVAPPENGSAHRARFTELDLLHRRSPIGLAMLDRELRFLHVNEALAEFHGISAEDLTGRPAQEVMPNLRENFAAVSKCAGDGGINLGRLVREVLDGGDKPANA